MKHGQKNIKLCCSVIQKEIAKRGYFLRLCKMLNNDEYRNSLLDC